jgi:hypothetical protein
MIKDNKIMGGNMSEVKYKIIEKIAILSGKGNWTKELNKISWNDRSAKYDLRDWNHKNGIVGKGITLTEEELKNLKVVLNALEI